MGLSLAELARLVDGRLEGDGDVQIEAALPLYDAGPGAISLLDHVDHADRLADSQASAVIVPENFSAAKAGRADLPYIIVAKPHAAFMAIIQHFRPARARLPIGVSPAAHVSPSAKIGEGAEIHPGASIDDDVEIGARAVIHAGVRVMPGCKIGEDAVIYPNVVLYDDTIVGARSIIHAGAVIGGHGFGYRTEAGKHTKSAQLGWVEIGADVEIGALTTVDRGSYGATHVGDGTKVDNLVMIAHNVRLGKHNLICSQTGVAGSTSSGDYVVMAGQCGVRDHVHIGDKAVLGARSAIMGDVPAGGKYLGMPATPEKEQWLLQASIAKLPELRKQLRKLDQTVASLEKKLAEPCDAKQDEHAA